jgi:excisionase family DNA binding protein
LLARIRELHAQGLRPPVIARALQADGWRSAHGKGFTEGSVRALLTRMGVVSTSPKRPSAVVARCAGELTVTEIAARLNLPEGTVYNWLYKGRLSARRVEAAWHTLWLVRLEDVEAGAPPAAGGSGPASSPTGCITMTITDQRIDNPNLDLFWRGTMAKTRACSRSGWSVAASSGRCRSKVS